MDADEKIIELHASRGVDWLTCAKRTAWEQEHVVGGDPEETHVGVVVGNQVGHAITGHEHDEPLKVVYDEVTRSEKEQVRQTADMIQAARDGIEAAGWVIEEKEYPMEKAARYRDGVVVVRGTADMVVRDPDGLRWIVDLKTGKRKPDGVFVQVALYCFLWRETRPDDALAGGGVLWVERRKLSKKVCEPEMATRSTEDLAKPAEEVIKYMANVAVTGAVASPSIIGCARCPIKDECPSQW